MLIALTYSTRDSFFISDMYFIRREIDPFQFLSDIAILSNLCTSGKCQKWYNSAEARMPVVAVHNITKSILSLNDDLTIQ